MKTTKWMSQKIIKSAVILLPAVGALVAGGQIPKSKYNHDESKVKPYTLPDPLVCFNGQKVNNVKEWREVRRPEILAAFETNVYGRTPQLATDLKFITHEADGQAFNGLATRRQVEIRLFKDSDEPRIDLLIYIPKDAPKPVPAFLRLSYGNQGISADPAIIASRNTISTNGQHASSWDLEMLLKRGYAVVTFAGADVEIDRYGSGTIPQKRGIGWRQHGVRGYALKKAGRTEPNDDEWGTLAAWAWGMSRAMDYLETDKDIDAKKVAVIGHSRTGKATLWAAAKDERFALAISNNSGEGGAALAKRWFGETVELIPAIWFCGNHKKFADNVAALPVDQHLLVALIAPRPVYIASASRDLWADPRGEFLSAFHAEPVFRLYGLKGVDVKEMPQPDNPVGDSVRYHVRTGDHAVTPYDWEQYISFADRHFGYKISK
ncbi:MAG: acetylxylan esterase [Kiritimatiellia bacterium]